MMGNLKSLGSLRLFSSPVLDLRRLQFTFRGVRVGMLVRVHVYHFCVLGKVSLCPFFPVGMKKLCLACYFVKSMWKMAERRNR